MRGCDARIFAAMVHDSSHFKEAELGKKQKKLEIILEHADLLVSPRVFQDSLTICVV